MEDRYDLDKALLEDLLVIDRNRQIVKQLKELFIDGLLIWEYEKLTEYMTNIDKSPELIDQHIKKLNELRELQKILDGEK